jgi:hypothetical protein
MTSVRPETHTTFSVWVGCTASTSAATTPSGSERVHRTAARVAKKHTAACSSVLTR